MNVKSQTRSPRGVRPAPAPAPLPVGGGARVPCCALILAGGSGTRLGSARPKAFVALGGEPLLCWNVRAFARHPAVSDLLTVVPPGWEAAYRDEIIAPMLELLGPNARKLHGAVAGGERRQDSARIGLQAVRTLYETAQALPSNRAGAAHVLVHDAARPCVEEALITRLVARLEQGERVAGAADMGRSEQPLGVIPILAIEDTLKRVIHDQQENRVSGTVPREGLCRAQTPQAFALAPLLKAHQDAHAEGRVVTDDAALYEWKGWPVATVPGSPLAVKITSREDLELLEAWIARRESEALR